MALHLNNPVPKRFRGFRPRAALMLLVFVLIGVVLAGRAFYLQVVQHDELSRLAQRQSQRTIKVKGRRGPILDRKGNRLAFSVEADSFYARPREVSEPARTAWRLGRALDVDPAALEESLRSDAPFVWVKRQVTPLESAVVRGLALPGIRATREYRRVYPWRDFAAPLLGFTGVDTQGLEGLEYAYDSALKGDEAVRVIDRDALGRAVLTGEERPLTGGGAVRLTIHPGLQRLAERALMRAVESAEADLGIALVMRTHTGELLAVAHEPAFNPNNYAAYDKESYFNRAITSGYEPGSTMKVITTAVALQEGVVEPGSLFFCENGRWEFYDSTIHDTSTHGWLSLGGVIRVSSNICAAKVGLSLPAPVFAEYLHRFGFGQRVGVFEDAEGNRLAGEAEGYVLPVDKWTPVDQAAMSFGHGILVSPLQLLAAVNVIATGGEYVPPRLVLEVRDALGQVVARPQAGERRRLISPQVTAQVRAFMQEVVSADGTGYRAAVEGFPVAGKTGTTEVYDIKARGYSKTKHIASFAGFAPANRPELTVLVLIERPKKGRYGGVVAAPVFRRIVEQGLPLLGIWPHENVRHVGGQVASAEGPPALP